MSDLFLQRERSLLFDAEQIHPFSSIFIHFPVYVYAPKKVFKRTPPDYYATVKVKGSHIHPNDFKGSPVPEDQSRQFGKVLYRSHKGTFLTMLKNIWYITYRIFIGLSWIFLHVQATMVVKKKYVKTGKDLPLGCAWQTVTALSKPILQGCAKNTRLWDSWCCPESDS